MQFVDQLYRATFDHRLQHDDETYPVNYPTHKGMGLVIQIPISGQTTIGGLTAALSFRKSARIFIAAL